MEPKFEFFFADLDFLYQVDYEVWSHNRHLKFSDYPPKDARNRALYKLPQIALRKPGNHLTFDCLLGYLKNCHSKERTYGPDKSIVSILDENGNVVLEKTTHSRDPGLVSIGEVVLGDENERNVLARRRAAITEALRFTENGSVQLNSWDGREVSNILLKRQQRDPVKQLPRTRGDYRGVTLKSIKELQSRIANPKKYGLAFIADENQDIVLDLRSHSVGVIRFPSQTGNGIGRPVPFPTDEARHLEEQDLSPYLPRKVASTTKTYSVQFARQIDFTPDYSDDTPRPESVFAAIRGGQWRSPDSR